MGTRKSLLLFADYFDATTATRRVVNALNENFDQLEFVYWARLGHEREINEEIFKNIPKKVYKETAPPRSFGVLVQFVKYQMWLFKTLLEKKPSLVIAFTFYTIFPALFYRLFINRKSKVIYDPRDYVAVSYRVNIVISSIIRFLDNLCMKFSDFVIFPDKQYFSHYGMFKLPKNKYFVLPNSAEDVYNQLEDIDLEKLYNIPVEKPLIPILGYFSETRGKELLFRAIQDENLSEFHFVFAGDLRDESEISFLNSKKNVTFLPKVPYLHALKIIQKSIVVPQLYDPKLLNNVYAFPTKYFDCLMVETPMIVSSGQKDVLEEIKKYNFGFGIEYDDYDGFVMILKKLLKNELVVDKKSLRTFFLNTYNYNLYKQKLADIYKDIYDSIPQ
ncbi:glycosyltransferase family 4 protein [Chryseobacterium sp. RP-3-3]|uniref:Glycosyltransferase family 4 protein n=1 Tax=Chryseobacterium antibioticum TaxID=2728847 RepID=A0A7Y0FSA9_9FLAO|nr:glycosyltransferase [Chryseobacterium antibioticum]NML70471.1 glycosyltransferase family 4 protein [Chryseobacterium antibioticum]